MPAVKIGIALIQSKVEGIGGGTGEGGQRNIGNGVRPGVSNLPGQPVGKPAVNPNLKGLVVRLAIGLTHGDGPKIWEHATRVYNVCQVGITGGECLDHSSPLARVDVVDRHTTPPDVRAVIANVRNFGHRVPENFTRDR